MWVFLLGTILVFMVVGTVSCLHTDPLRQIPGPWLASVTNMYGFFYNLTGGGYSKRFVALHKQYSK